MLLLSVLVPAAVIAVILAVLAWNTSRRSTEQELVSEAKGLASDIARELEIMKGVLLALATSPSLAKADLPALQAQMARALRPDGAMLQLIDAGGAIRASSPPAPGRLPREAHDPALIARVFQTNQPQVSELIATPGQSGRSAGYRFCVDVPVELAGKVAYDLRMSVSPAVLTSALTRQNLPGGQAASVLDGGGRTLARSDDGNRLVGQQAPTDFRSHPHLNTFLATSPEGHAVLAAAADVAGTGWTVVVETPRDLIEGALLRTLAIVGAASAAMLALGLPISAYHARRIARPLQSLAIAAEALGRGDAPQQTPPGVREATRTGLALASAAAALQQREQERDRAEAARQAGEARLARLLSTTPTGIVEIDVRGLITFANAAAEKMLGGASGGLTGRAFDHPAWQASRSDGQPASPDRFPAAWALRGETVHDYQHTVSAANGRRIVLLANIVPVRGADGRVDGALAAFQDITARDDQARLLQESEARFRHLADSVPALIWMNGMRGEVAFANMHFGHVFGRPPSDMQGLGWTEVVMPQDLEPFRAAYRAAFRERKTFQWTVRVRDKTGTVRWLRCESVPRLNDVGMFLGYTGCAVDVTAARLAAGELERRVAARTEELKQAVDALHAEALERAQAESQLRQSQKMEAVGQLTGGIAHDFNNMLQAIGGSLELVKRRADQGRLEDAAQFIGNAQKTVERAASLTHRLLAFARRQALQPRPVEPNALAEGMADLINRTTGANVSARLELCRGAWTVLCDPNQLENVLLNLAINARDAMPEGGELVTSTANRALSEADVAGQGGARPGEFVEIAVSDTGSGMDEATKARAFEPFFTTKPVGQGSGLGLSQLYGFMQQSGGFVRLDSAPGKGTTFRLYFPRHDPAPDAPERPIG